MRIRKIIIVFSVMFVVVSLVATGCSTAKCFVVNDEISCSNAAGGWRVDIASSKRDIFDIRETMVCNVYIEHNKYFRHGVCLSSEFDSHGPFDMKRFGVVPSDSIRSHYACVAKCGRYNEPYIKVCVEIGVEDFSSIESLEEYLGKCRFMAKLNNVSLSERGVQCLMFPWMDSDSLSVEVVLLKVRGAPIPKEIVKKYNDIWGL